MSPNSTAFEKPTVMKRLDYRIKIQSIFIGKTDSTLFQLLRYTFVGGLAFLCDFGTLFFLTEFFHIHYLVSAGIGFLVGLITNYYLSVKWIFNDRVFDNRLLEFLLFSLIGIIGLGLNEFFIWMFTYLFAIYYLISKIITTLIVYLWNFFARKFILFNKPNS